MSSTVTLQDSTAQHSIFFGRKHLHDCGTELFTRTMIVRGYPLVVVSLSLSLSLMEDIVFVLCIFRVFDVMVMVPTKLTVLVCLLYMHDCMHMGKFRCPTRCHEGR